MKFKVEDKVFEESYEAYEYCEEEDLDIEEIEEIPENEEEMINLGYDSKEAYCKDHPEDPICKEHRKKVHGEIDDSEETELDEEGSISEEDLEEYKEYAEALEDYEEFPKEERDIILEKVLQDQDPMRPAKRATEFLDLLGEDVLEKLTNETSYVCPFCHKDVKTLAELEGEKVSESAKFAKFEHFKNYHKELYEVITSLFPKPKSERKYDDEPVGVAESCSEEELSKEELAEEISKNPELREALYRKWIEKEQKREK